MGISYLPARYQWLSGTSIRPDYLILFLEELGLIPQTDSTDNKLIPDLESNPIPGISDDEIKRISQEVLNKYRTQKTNQGWFGWQ